MKLLFWQWHSFMGKGVERALKKLKIEYDTFFYQMKDWENDKEFVQQLEKRLISGLYNVVFSINFNPIISDVCEKYRVAYRAWVYDSPIHIRNLAPLKNAYTKVYFFDRGQADEYRKNGIGAEYLPLASDVEIFYPIAVSEQVLTTSAVPQTAAHPVFPILMLLCMMLLVFREEQKLQRSPCRKKNAA